LRSAVVFAYRLGAIFYTLCCVVSFKHVLLCFLNWKFSQMALMRANVIHHSTGSRLLPLSHILPKLESFKEFSCSDFISRQEFFLSVLLCWKWWFLWSTIFFFPHILFGSC